MSRVRSPGSGNDKVSVSPGDRIQVELSLYLPLTPPPGVQQPRAWEGWSASFRRSVDRVHGNAESLVVLPGRLIRIRPSMNGLYTMNVATLPWMPPGTFDLVVSGPGFEEVVPSAVQVQGIEGLGEPVYVAFPGELGGLQAMSGEKNITPVWAGFTKLPVAGESPDKLLLFQSQEFDVNGSVSLQGIEGNLPEGEIVWSTGVDRISPVEWREARFVPGSGGDAGGEMLNVVWDLGDGDWGSGTRVRHRWIFGDAPEIRVYGFDSRGRVSKGQTVLAMEPPLGGSACCSCSAVGAGSREEGKLILVLAALALLGFFLYPHSTRE